MTTLERQWIEQLQARWPQADLRHDTFYDPDTRQILTTDMLVEDVHFSRKTFSPEDIGWKGVAVNYSDIAATGGRPHWLLVSLGLPEQADLTLARGIYDGITACCQAYGGTLTGGDTVRSEKLTLSVTAIGLLEARYQPGRRHTAQPGDFVAVSGPHGLSRAGLEALKTAAPQQWPAAVSSHCRPVPRLRLGQQIARTLPRFAMMDTSDGLADAALRLAQASRVDIVLDAERIRLHPEMVDLASLAGANPLDWALYGGEDFELMVALPPEAIGLFPEMQVVGYVRACQPPEKDGQAWLRTASGLAPLEEGRMFQHFHSEEPGVTYGH